MIRGDLRRVPGGEPVDRASLDGILRFLMTEAPAYMTIAGTYRVVDLVADLAAIAVVDEGDRRRH